MGSKNGTFLNGERLSAPRVASGKEEVCRKKERKKERNETKYNNI